MLKSWIPDPPRMEHRLLRLGFFQMRVLKIEANDFCCSAVIQVCGSNRHWQRGTLGYAGGLVLQGRKLIGSSPRKSF